jgi:16S rRNA (guanine966-N2)-methyltransferase
MPKIIAGTLGGRVIKSPPGLILRPMMSKVRAALFDMLWHFNALHGRALDLYAGTGAVGIEALSRGVEFVDFVELNPVCVRMIQQNLKKLRVEERGQVHRRKVEDILAKPRLLGYSKPYQLVSVTPPYVEVDYVELANSVASSRLIAAGTIVVFEHPRQVELEDEIGPLVRLRYRKYGRTVISIYDYRFNEDDE